MFMSDVLTKDFIRISFASKTINQRIATIFLYTYK